VGRGSPVWIGRQDLAGGVAAVPLPTRATTQELASTTIKTAASVVVETGVSALTKDGDGVVQLEADPQGFGALERGRVPEEARFPLDQAKEVRLHGPPLPRGLGRQRVLDLVGASRIWRATVMHAFHRR
jgi:hypothetical protein